MAVREKPIHILFLTDNFPPEVNAPASRTFEHCKEWIRAGYKVTVITGFPNFPKGKVFDGYKNRFWETEIVEGIEVIRVWTYITANEGFIRRIIDYISFMVAAVAASVFVKDADVVIGTSPQFFTACAAYLTGSIKRIPFVFELRDIWPESIKVVGAMKDSVIIRLVERVEMFLYRKADLIISVTNSFKKTLVNRGIDGNKIKVVLNGADLTHYRPVPKDEELVGKYGLKGKFVTGYIGTHGMAHALEVILVAAAESSCSDVVFLMIGDGAKKQHLKDEAERKGLNNVLFIDTVSKEEVLRYYSLLDASIIHLKKNDLFKTVIPSKLFECMAMGIPVLLGVEGEAAEIVENDQCGILFEPENADALCWAIKYLKDDKTLREKLRNNSITAAAQYERRVNAVKMLGLLSDRLREND